MTVELLNPIPPKSEILSVPSTMGGITVWWVVAVIHLGRAEYHMVDLLGPFDVHSDAAVARGRVAQMYELHKELVK